MCGICGIAVTSIGGAGELGQIVNDMNNQLIHRGPDEGGVWSSDQIAIAMRRLSILDLETGTQPIFNEDRSLVIVFNGEVYNHNELRERLRQKGHQFFTHSDTEVVLRAFEEYGTEAPKHLEGMFAFCIVEIQRKSIFLARDRFGEKPLFFWHTHDKFGFSSELASLLAWRAVPRNLDFQSLSIYLRQSFPLPSQTMFRDIRQLLPGCSMTWRDGQLKTDRYFVYAPEPDETLTEEDAVESVSGAILKAVSRQRLADVPVGAFLSGGIDSSVIVAAMARQSTRPVPTFTAKFEHASYDESPMARKTANFLGTDHHEFVIPDQGFDPEDLWRVIRHVGQPFHDSSAIPTYYICRQIRSQVKVCLSGDGGDEMFGGYSFFKYCQTADRVARFGPQFAFQVAESMVQGLGQLPGFSRVSRLRQLRRLLAAAGTPAIPRLRNMAPQFEEREIGSLVLSKHLPALAQPDFTELDAIISAQRNGTRLRQMMAFRVGYNLSEDMLPKVDRMSMASSLEVRAPLLDVAVADAAAKLPDRLLIKGGTLKYVLRQVGRKWLPPELFTKPKTGFSIPLHRYFNKKFGQLCDDLVLGQNSLCLQVFQEKSLRKIVDRGLNCQRDGADVSVFRASHQLWGIVQLAAWANHFSVSL